MADATAAAATPTVVCAGAASEYPFATFAERVRSRGVPCVELDMALPGWRARLDVARRAPDRVLVTSQHAHVTALATRLMYGVEMDVVSLAEMVRLVAPSRVVFVPHDLADPFPASELTAAGLIDAALVPPGDFSRLEAWTRTEPVGWIGALGVESADPVPGTPVAFLPSEVGAYVADPVRFEETFSPVLALRPCVKLPPYPGVETLESIAQRHGCRVLPAATPAMAVIAASAVVVSNGVSSVVAEAALSARAVYCVADGLHPAAVQRAAFADVAGVEVATAAEVAARIAGRSPDARTGVPGVDLTFDFDRALEIVVGDLPVTTPPCPAPANATGGRVS